MTLLAARASGASHRPAGPFWPGRCRAPQLCSVSAGRAVRARPGCCPLENDPMTRFFGLKATLALAHLALVVCGAARFLPAPRESRAARLVLMYGEYSGSDNG